MKESRIEMPPSTAALLGMVAFVVTVSSRTIGDSQRHCEGSEAVPYAASSAGALGLSAVGTALDFDGIDDRAVIAYSPSLDVVSYTVEAWVFPRSIPRDVENVAAVVNRWTFSPSSEVFLLGIKGPIGGPAQVFAATGNALWWGVAAGSFSLNEWHHVATVFDSAAVEQRLYLDGSPVGIFPAAGPMNSSGASLEIGHEVAGPNRWFDGLIDEVRLWNISRTAPEILADYSRTICPSTPGLIGYWRFEGSSGLQSVLDQSPYQNDGTLGASGAADPDDPLWVPSAAPLVPTVGPGIAYGTGCAGSGGFVPHLSNGPDCAVPGGVLGFSVTDGLGGSLGVLVFGATGPASIPALGCLLLLNPPHFSVGVVPLAGAPGMPGAGSGSASLGLPSNPAITGLSIYFQVALFDPVAPFAVSFSNGLQVAIA